MNAPDWFLDRAQNEMIPKMAESVFIIGILNGAVDAKIAVEVGAAVLLGKPILILALPGVAISEKLRRVADRIVECDVRTNAGRAAVNRAIHEMIESLGLGKEGAL
jgi:hypothetical protein